MMKLYYYITQIYISILNSIHFYYTLLKMSDPNNLETIYMDKPKIQNKYRNNGINSDKFKNVCRNWMNGKCSHPNCKFIHDPELCVRFYNTGKCDGLCDRNHFANPNLSNQNFRPEQIKKTNSSNNLLETHYNTKRTDSSESLNKSEFIINTTNNFDKQFKSAKNNIQNKKIKSTQNNELKQNKLTNTETFKANFSPPEMRVRIGYNINDTSNPIQSNDLILTENLFADEPNIYEKLLDEVFATNFDKHDLVIPWHEGCHLIVDDNLDWKKSCPTFNKVVEKLAQYYGMNVKATRFNWYQKNTDHKFFHHDGAALKESLGQIQNCTIGVSFGTTREMGFQVANHNDCRSVVSFPLSNGTTYLFGKDVNIDWRHGILPIKTIGLDNDEKKHKGRVSIILWGWVEQINLKPNNHIGLYQK